MEERLTRFGYASLLGRPNVGKSTLLNNIIKEKIAITSPKPQTTRNRITGIYTAEEGQIVFLDTPGIHDPTKEINRRMVREARQAADQADVSVMLIEAHRPWLDNDLLTLDLIEKLDTKKILVINKVDRTARENVLPVMDHSSKLSVFDEIVPLSALTGDNVDSFVKVVMDLMPESEPLFPDDMITDQLERFWVSEVIREKLVRNTRDELPYTTAVRIDKFEETEGLIRIAATIAVERDSQKGIVIGKGGSMLKKIGTAARRDIEDFLGKNVYLDINVKVDPRWWREMEGPTGQV